MKKVFILFMSHRCGEHGLTVHNTIDEVKKEVESVVEVIHEGSSKALSERIEDLTIVKSIKGGGFYAELSDSTWFDVFEKEI